MTSMRREKGRGQVVPEGERGIVVGIDVSKRHFHYGAFGREQRGRVVRAAQNAEGFAKLQESLRGLQDEGKEVWVGLEPTGPYGGCLAEWLVDGGWRVVQVNPYHVKRTKELRDNSPAKTDSKDCGVIADLVWGGYYQELAQVDGVYAQLRVAGAEWRCLTKDGTAVRNRFQAHMAVWFPELNQIFEDGVCKTVRGVVRAYESPGAVRAGRMRRLKGVVRRAASGRTVGRAPEIWAAAKASVAVCRGQQARQRAMVALLDQLEHIEGRQEYLKGEMSALLEGLLGAQAMLTLPGIGVITVAGLLGECGDLEAFEGYGRLEKHVGLNLYEVSSGQHRGRLHIAKRGRARARYVVCHAAMMLSRKKALYGDYAREQRKAGKKTGEIRVAIARRLLRLLYGLARTKMAFDPERYLTGDSTADGPVIHQGTLLPEAA